MTRRVSLQTCSALGALRHAMQVVINAGELLEQELGHSLDPPTPRRFLYPRDPEKTAATAATPVRTRDLDEQVGTDTAGDTPEVRQLQEGTRPPRVGPVHAAGGGALPQHDGGAAARLAMEEVRPTPRGQWPVHPLCEAPARRVYGRLGTKPPPGAQSPKGRPSFPKCPL